MSKLGDTVAAQGKAILDLLQLIKDIPMDSKQDYDVLGFVYEYLISNFAANAGKKAGEFYTPYEVSLLMSEIVANHLKELKAIEIYDPTSGSGSLLINMPCVICVANDFTRYDEHAVNQMQKNIRLVRYKLFGDDLILLEQINAPNVAPMKDISSSDSSVTTKNKTYKTFDEQLASADPKIRQIYESLHDYIMSLGDDISENRLKLYSAYKKIKNIVCLEIRMKSIMVYLKLDKSDVELVDGFSRDVSNIGHWGTGDIEITIKNEADFIKAKDYILKAYQVN